MPPEDTVLHSPWIIKQALEQWTRERSYTLRPDSECPRQTSSRDDRHARKAPTVSLFIIHTQAALSLRASESLRAIARHLAEEQFLSRHPLCALRRRYWTAIEWNQVVFNDESRFSLGSDDNRVRVWRPSGELLNPAFAIQQHIAPTTGRETFLASSFYSQYGLPTISGLPLHDGKGRYRPEKSMTDSPKGLSQLV
ncbi:transposable element Tcb2 transposase [Trichonephila clavipes]|nr:transposable element Tcb2 transposase [Trichonephila clavipes]